MAYASIYFEASRDPDKDFLRESGYKRFPVLAPRWEVTGNDIYGTSPGMEALGDVKQLQHQQLRKTQAIDYMVNPPLQVPTAYKDAARQRLPGGVMYVDTTQQNGGIRSAFEVNLNLQHLQEDIMDVRQRINAAYYADMFLMMANDTRSGVTATEIAERHEEKLLMLGPVLERLHSELLEPLVTHTFQRALEVGILPPLPEELADMPLNVEFVSMLAQAQKAVSVNSTDRLIGHIGMIAQAKGDTAVWDKFDSDMSVERYADQLGVDPDLIVPGDKVALIREQRAQMIAQQQQQEAMSQMAQSASALGGVQTGPAASDNAGADLINLFSGYGSPSATELQ